MMATSDGLTVLHTAGNDFIGGGGGGDNVVRGGK